MTTAELNLLIDFICDLGNVTRLAKSLKNQGFSPRIITYDTIRVREQHKLTSSGNQAVARILEFVDFARSTHPLWNTLCVEMWAELNVQYRREPVIFEHAGLCIYARTGVDGKLVLKLTWLSPCRKQAGEYIPESITRFCTTDPGNLEGVKSKVSQFASALPTLLSTLKSDTVQRFYR